MPCVSVCATEPPVWHMHVLYSDFVQLDSLRKTKRTTEERSQGAVPPPSLHPPRDELCRLQQTTLSTGVPSPHTASDVGCFSSVSCTVILSHIFFFCLFHFTLYSPFLSTPSCFISHHSSKVSEVPL